MPVESTFFTQVSKYLEWKTALKEESNALIANQTWTPYPRPSNQNTIRYKWIEPIKLGHPIQDP